MVFQTLNRLRWQNLLEGSDIIILHRGSPGDRKIIPGESLTELKKGYLCFSSGERETVIPLHRVLEIRLKGEMVWKKSKPNQHRHP